MTKYRHIPTGEIWELHNPQLTTVQRDYYNKGNIIPARIIETGSDWKKVEEKKDFEILTYNSTVKTLSFLRCVEGLDKLLKDGTITIDSVRRLSDGEEFKVGQETYQGSILEFKEYGNRMIANIRTIGVETYYAAINELEPIPERKPLFKTEDGKEVFDGELGYFVDKLTFKINEWKIECVTAPPERSDFHIFSTREAAEEYVINNKPIFCLSELWNNPGGCTHKGDQERIARERCGFKKKEESK